MIRLAFSGVRESSLMGQMILDDPDADGRGSVSGKRRHLSEASWRIRRIGIFGSLGHHARDVRSRLFMAREPP
jgi:hypothetical protein